MESNAINKVVGQATNNGEERRIKLKESSAKIKVVGQATSNGEKCWIGFYSN